MSDLNGCTCEGKDLSNIDPKCKHHGHQITGAWPKCAIDVGHEWDHHRRERIHNDADYRNEHGLHLCSRHRGQVDETYPGHTWVDLYDEAAGLPVEPAPASVVVPDDEAATWEPEPAPADLAAEPFEAKAARFLRNIKGFVASADGVGAISVDGQVIMLVKYNDSRHTFPEPTPDVTG